MEKQASYATQANPSFIKEKPIRAYETWTDDEEGFLIEKFNNGLKTQQIAELLQRTHGAILSRLRKLGLRD